MVRPWRLVLLLRQPDYSICFDLFVFRAAAAFILWSFLTPSTFSSWYPPVLLWFLMRFWGLAKRQDMAELWTSGWLEATRHRVDSPAFGQEPRRSFVLFQVRCLEAWVEM